LAKTADLEWLSIKELGALLKRRKLSPVELVRHLLARIETLNPALNAFLTVPAETALAEARRAESELARGKWRGPLHGIPVALKDNISTQGVRTTAGARFLSDHIPENDAAVVFRLRRAGAIILGKTNLHEFAYGVTTTNPHYGTTRNPWDRERIAGGSSGGSAAALAAGLAPAALGSDTGGSIRIPAAMCGVAGLKPTFGRVSCRGTVALSPSLDHVGPMARTAEDLALLLGVLAGHDARDPVSVRRPVENFLREMRRPPRRLRLVRPREFFFDRVDGEVASLVEKAIAEFTGMGVSVEEISWPAARELARPATAIALAEATRFHRRQGWYPAHADDYGEDVRARLELGEKVSAVEYFEALDARRRLQEELDRLLTGVDALLAPTVPVAAPLIGTEELEWAEEREPVRAALLRLNRPANMTGNPAVSIPCGFTRAGLPVGLQLIGRRWEEGRLLAAAAAYEAATGGERKRRPPAV
jgi:aspartyl-tRNA(Asn)/glutamyl-tRNA(Gln) amidotransferase subunit A